MHEYVEYTNYYLFIANQVSLDPSPVSASFLPADGLLSISHLDTSPYYLHSN